MRPFNTLVLGMIALTCRGGACTIAYSSIPVGPNFRVRVEDNGRPVKGLRVQIASLRGSSSRIVKDTDAHGFALFRGVRPGSYDLSAQPNAGFEYGVALEVRLDGPAGATVPLTWPGTAPVLVRSLKGTIRGPDYVHGQSQRRLSLDLLDGNSGHSLKLLETDENGTFNDEGARPGKYVLNLRPSGLTGGFGDEITGLIVVAVDRSAPTDFLDLDLEWSSCGLHYTQSSNCPQSDLRIDRVSGQVVDSSGGSIPRAKILLFDPAGTLVEQLQSGEGGEFASSRPFAGAYKLAVSSAGFTPLRRTVHVEPAPEQTRRSRTTVQLGVFGSCSDAHVH